MTRRALRTLGALSVVAALAAACGKKGDPLPPIPIVPAAVNDLTAGLSSGVITLEFTVPAADPNNETIVAPDRIEIYRLEAPVEGEAPSPQSIVGEPRYLRRQIPVRPAEVEVAPGTTPTGPAAGERTTYAEPIDPASPAPSRTYVVVGAVGRNRRSPIAAVTVPLASLPPAPETLVLSHDEREILVTWTAGGTAYRVFGVPSATGSAETEATLLTATPLTEPRYVTPVEFGRERCFAVRTVVVAGPATVEGPPSAPACLTPVDVYPPAAPSGLRAIQEGSAITLTWTPSPSPDLAGYVVLRGDANGVDMQPLVKEPVREPTFRDTTAQPGVTYTYSVYAVDNAPTPNVSQQSERQLVAVR